MGSSALLAEKVRDLGAKGSLGTPVKPLVPAHDQGYD